jgi:hypothetical protein
MRKIRPRKKCENRVVPRKLKERIQQSQATVSENTTVTYRAHGTKIPDLLTGRPFTIKCY